MTAEWNQEASRLLTDLLHTSIQCAITLPTKDDARQALAQNTDLHGKITLTFDDLGKSFDVDQILLPYEGLFVRHKENSQRPLIMVWNSWLDEMPGLRLVRLPQQEGQNEQQRQKLEWRLGLPGGGFLKSTQKAGKKTGTPTASVESGQESSRKSTQKAGKGTPKKIPPFLKEFIQNNSGLYPDVKMETVNTWKDLLGLLSSLPKEEKGASDLDDLEHRILITFPVWLKFQLARQLFQMASDQTKDARYWPDALLEALQEDRSHDRPRLQNSLIPIQNPHYASQAGLVFVEPRNALELAARLTHVKRLRITQQSAKSIPEAYRQIHPSFKGRLCPVDSPESEWVGLALQLAQGATVNAQGLIRPAPENDPLAQLGWGAGLIPFYPHNDGARNMMGAKNLRQALPVAAREAPAVLSGGEKTLADFMRPFAGLGLFPDDGDTLKLGVDLLTAYLPWKGWNMEDAIVISESAADKMGIGHQATRRFTRTIPVGVELDKDCSTGYLVEGMVPKGTLLHHGDPVARFRTQDGTTFTVSYEEDAPGLVAAIALQRKQPYMDGVFTYEVEFQIPLRLGDKLMGRHGNKGVVGQILPDEQMPRLPDAAELGEWRNRPIEILLNPHGVISRMNPGQLLETHLAWLLHHNHRDAEFLTPSDRRPCGYPDIDRLDHDKIQQLLEESGLDRYGKIRLTLPDGKQTLSPVLVGYEHIVRLAHIPMLKEQARRGGDSYLYSSKTGQAIHGRRLGGGQRLGEMEVWALAAYNANHILDEMLGPKAAAPQAPAKFPELLRDYLRALLIEWKDGHLQFSRDPKALKNLLGGETHQVSSVESLDKSVVFDFRCQHEECDGTHFEKIRVPLDNAQKNDTPSLKLGWLLRSWGYSAENATPRSEHSLAFPIQDCATGAPAGTLLLEAQDFNPQKKFFNATLTPEGTPPARWPDNIVIHCRRTFKGDKKEGKNNGNAQTLWDKLKTRPAELGEISVVCEKHQSQELRGHARAGAASTLTPTKHSLFDPAIFGDVQKTSAKSRSQWGFIELPVPIPYPEKLNGFTVPKGAPEITILPVLPLCHRPLAIHPDRINLDTLDQDGYLPVLEACKAYTKGKDNSKNAPKKKEQLKKAVTRLFQIIMQFLDGKTGFVRYNGLGRRVDRSARMVIAPNPELNWNQAGIPVQVLWELMGDQVLQSNTPPAGIGVIGERLEGQDAITSDRASQQLAQEQKALEQLAKWNRRTPRTPEIADRQERLLTRFLEDHPDTLVLLNRQPSLHRYSFHAFHPVPIPGDTEVIQLSPLACKDFGADFDGDEMVLHFPLSPEAQEDARRLLPDHNLLSLANGKPTAHYEQDFVMGTYWLLTKPSGLEDLCEDFQNLLQGAGISSTPSKDEHKELLPKICNKPSDSAISIISRWMRLALEACTRAGVSFGFYDCLSLQKDLAKQKCPEDDNSILEDKVKKHLEEVCKPEKVDWATPGLHIAAMSTSGARGKPEQLRQLIAARGDLQTFGPDGKPIFFKRTLCDGLNASDSFSAAMNARHSFCDKKLGTAQAGAITRRLVFALWPYVVDGGKIRSILDNSILCPAEDLFKDGKDEKDEKDVLREAIKDDALFPIGLVAAQSIGERGTQLSMQSFHTGTTACDLKWVKALLELKSQDGKDSAAEDDFCTEFQKDGSPYEKLNPAYFRLLWRVISKSDKRTLSSAAAANDDHDLLTSIAHTQTCQKLLEAAASQIPIRRDSPVAHVFFADF